MPVRTSTIDPQETPISSAKYNTEMNDIYEHLTRHDSFNTSPYAPDNPTVGVIWYDSNYNPPLEKRWNGIAWQWAGTFIWKEGGTAFPPEDPAIGAVRVNANTGVTEYWDGNDWIAVTVATGAGTFSGAGAYLWDREITTPTGIFNPVIGYGFNLNTNAIQAESDAGDYRDIFVVGGDALPLRSCMFYNLNAGQTEWKQVTGLDIVAANLGLNPDMLVTVESIVGFDGDSTLPDSITDTPFVFAMIRASVGEDTGFHYLVGIRVTDDGFNIAGQAIKGLAIPAVLSKDKLAMAIINGALHIGGADDTNTAKIWRVTWSQTNFTMDAYPLDVSGFTSPVSALASYFTQNTIALTLSNGQYVGQIGGSWSARDINPGTLFHKMYFVQPDNRMVAIGLPGVLYEGKNGSLAQTPQFSANPTFDGTSTKAYSGVTSGRRHTELIVGSAVVYGVEYGAIFERKMGSTDYFLVWQSEYGDVMKDISYAGVRNMFLTIGMDAVTKEMTAIYNSDLRSVADYFTSINNQLRTLTTIVNTAMYKGGAKKGEIRAWTQPAENIPEGWALCDGSYNAEYGGNVPDLRGRFLRASVSGQETGIFGGQNSFILAEANLPAHKHSLGSHIHRITAVAHSHTFNHTHSYTGGSHFHSIAGGSSGGGSASFSGTTQPGGGIPSAPGPNSGTHSHSCAPGVMPFATGGSFTYVSVATQSGGPRALIWNGSGTIGTWNSLTSSETIGGLNNHTHGMSGTVTIPSVTVPNTTGAATPGIQITAYHGSTGPAAGVGTETSAPTTNDTSSVGSGQPVVFEPQYYSVMWIIATRDHAAAEGVDTSFLSVDQMMAILNSTSPSANNHFLTMLDVPTLPPGPPGMSAYEYAVGNGFQGTVEQWIQSLNGPAGESAYAIALSNGFIGTQQEWLASMQGHNGVDGRNGKTAYEVAVENGYTGTASEWIASLHTVDIPEGTAADVSKILTKVGPLKNDLAWVEPSDATEEVLVFNYYPTATEIEAIEEDSLVMIGNETPDQSPFAATSLDYKIDTRTLGLRMTDQTVKGQVVLPLCEMPMGEDPGQAGMMAPEECLALHNVIDTVETLAMGGVFVATYATLALFQANHATIANGYAFNETHLMPGGRTEGTVNVSDFLFIDQDTDHEGSVTSYILVQDTTTGTKFWTFRRTEDTKIAQATNSTLGIVQGTPVNTTTGETDGKIRVEADGTMSLNGWNRIVENKLDKVDPYENTNFPAFNVDGALVDSGKNSSDFATAAQGALADTSMQRPTAVAGNVAQFTSNGNVSDSGITKQSVVTWSGSADDPAERIAMNGQLVRINENGNVLGSGIQASSVPVITSEPAQVKAYNVVMMGNDGGRSIKDSGLDVRKVADWTLKPTADVDYPEIASGGYIVRTAIANPDKIVAGGLNTTIGSLRYADVQNSLRYSTAEIPTGATWIDGKPIYRRVIQGALGPAPEQGISVPIGARTMVSFTLCAWNTISATTAINPNNINCAIATNGSVVIVAVNVPGTYASTGFNGQEYYCILEYTK
jgi:hypothetical protein